MKAIKIRVTIRWIHIILGLTIMCYIYSPFHENVYFQVIIKFIILPVIFLTGVWIWKFKAINHWLKIE